MARFEAPGLDDLIRDMQRLGEDAGPCAEAMVDQAAIVIRDEWRKSAEEKGLRATGAMIESIGFPEQVRKIGGVLSQDIYPQGTDSKGTRNAEKAFILNYGSRRIAPTYWVDDADAASGPIIEAKLTEMWGEFL